MSKYVCTMCGFSYREERGIPSQGIEPGTPWDSIPSDWVCPMCGAPRNIFRLLREGHFE